MSAYKVIAIFALLSVNPLAGCYLFLAGYNPIFWEYVYEKGGPKDIADWAVQQDDPERVWHVFFALGPYTDPREHSAHVDKLVEETVDALVQINDKYHAGWEFKATSNEQADPKFIPRRCYDGIAEAATFNEYARTQFFAVEPPPDSVSHKQWVAAAKYVGIVR